VCVPLTAELTPVKEVRTAVYFFIARICDRTNTGFLFIIFFKKMKPNPNSHAGAADCLCQALQPYAKTKGHGMHVC
jgi:hypothetical protein